MHFLVCYVVITKYFGRGAEVGKVHWCGRGGVPWGVLSGSLRASFSLYLHSYIVLYSAPAVDTVFLSCRLIRMKCTSRFSFGVVGITFEWEGLQTKTNKAKTQGSNSTPIQLTRLL